MSIEKLFISIRRIVLPILAVFVLAGISPGAPQAQPAQPAKEVGKEVAKDKPVAGPAKKSQPEPAKPDDKRPAPANVAPANDPQTATVPPVDPDDLVAVENAEAEAAAVARPVSSDPVQVFGWREHIRITGVEEKLKAKLDTGALTSSIHAEEQELFERDGKKWVRFIVTDPSMKKPVRTRIEAPLVRMAKIKEPGGASEAREVVRLSFLIGERKIRGEFTLNNRSNMLAPVLIGRNMIKDLGLVDPGRTHLADQKVFR